ncbi:hypothetical protein DRO91_07975 [Candidatus Heimdallarchaeota archaeon]|nr:MAG: hypothetical protein DRO91_07975 [Candidatus Heimdallarchaeota archaeon]
MKQLFNKYESYTKKGADLSNEIQKAIAPIMEEWSKKGYRVIDIERIFADCIRLKSTILKAQKELKMRKEKK